VASDLPRTMRGSRPPKPSGVPAIPSGPGGSGATTHLRRIGCEDFKSACNLPLAAQRVVGHTDRTGDVAEWLKAAVC
jgi:hypothetical protein